MSLHQPTFTVFDHLEVGRISDPVAYRKEVRGNFFLSGYAWGLLDEPNFWEEIDVRAGLYEVLRASTEDLTGESVEAFHYQIMVALELIEGAECPLWTPYELRGHYSDLQAELVFPIDPRADRYGEDGTILYFKGKKAGRPAISDLSASLNRIWAADMEWLFLRKGSYGSN